MTALGLRPARQSHHHEAVDGGDGQVGHGSEPHAGADRKRQTDRHQRRLEQSDQKHEEVTRGRLQTWNKTTVNKQSVQAGWTNKQTNKTTVNKQSVQAGWQNNRK